MFWSLLGQYYSFIIVLQVVCILHALRNRRNEWLYILFIVPVASAIVYLIWEVYPDIKDGRFFTDLKDMVNPAGKTKELEKKLRIADTETNKLNLAAEYARLKRYDKAIALAKACLTDIYANDPGIMLEVARLTCKNGDYTESIAYFDKVIALKNGRLERAEDELLYARALDGNGEAARAEEQYKKVIRAHHSMEAMYLYGMLLRKQNRHQEALKQFSNIQDEKELHPRRIRRLHSQWIRLAKKEMRAA